MPLWGASHAGVALLVTCRGSERGSKPGQRNAAQQQYSQHNTPVGTWGHRQCKQQMTNQARQHCMQQAGASLVYSHTACSQHPTTCTAKHCDSRHNSCCAVQLGPADRSSRESTRSPPPPKKWHTTQPAISHTKQQHTQVAHPITMQARGLGSWCWCGVGVRCWGLSTGQAEHTHTRTH